VRRQFLWGGAATFTALLGLASKQKIKKKVVFAEECEMA